LPDELPDRRRRPIPRRTFLSRMTLAALAGPPALGALAACTKQQPGAVAGPSDSAAPPLKIASPATPVTWPVDKAALIADGLMPEKGATLQLYNYADYIGPKVVKRFEKKYAAYDVKVRVSTFNDTDEALTKIRGGSSGYDIYFPSYDQIAKMVSGKLIRPLNQSYIPNIANVWSDFSNPWYDGDWHYTVPYSVYTTGIGWRADRITDDIAGMSNPYDVFWDEDFARRLAVIDDWHTAMSMVALRAGITDINSTKESDLATIQDQMVQMQSDTRPKVTITMYNDLPAGQLDLAQMWSGDVVNAQYYLPKGVGPEVLAYWYPSDGKGMVDNDLMVILKQGRNPVLAHLFLDFMLDETNALDNFGYIGYQPPQNNLTAEGMIRDGYVPKNLPTAIVKQEWFAEGYRLLELPPETDAAWHQVWQQFKAGA
jgi:spermidine/putrescine transport system substrate-binding protein